MPWVDTRKTKYGFEYLIGTVLIARAKWVRSAGSWLVEVTTPEPSDGASWIISWRHETMPLKDVTPYLHRRLEKPEPVPEID